MRGLSVSVLFVLITAAVFAPIVVLAIVKRLVPWMSWQARCSRWLDAIASGWMQLNAWHQFVLIPTPIELEGDLNLSEQEWYMMISNHQSWVDILVLLRVFNRRIPYLKFFLKQSLIWVPLLGIAWWALEFPFMRRYSRAELQRNPALKGKDIEQTRKSCEKFSQHPVTIINFLEGTRFTAQKQQKQKSPYQHLLPPKAGGLAFTLAAMNGQLHKLLNVTICYPRAIPSYWDYVSGRVAGIKVHVEQLPIPDHWLGNYSDDQVFRCEFQAKINTLWREKDQRLSAMLSPRD
jgi:1-acyl-sn-glycerol-3-phosphate acyltransferase